MTAILKAPFPYFGGKSKIAGEVWKRFGDPRNYVEPFFGSGAMLLARPTEPDLETVNDKDGLISNFWRALQAEPERVAEYADWPINENDLHARHAWLVGERESLASRLEGDPEYYDCKVAGWWVWGMACWIGSGFCSGKGAWSVRDGLLAKRSKDDEPGAITRQRPHFAMGGAQGVARARETDLVAYFHALSARLRRVRVCSGDWSRVCGPTPTTKNGITAVFLDPPYAAEATRADNLYREDCILVAHEVRAWALEQGSNPLMRIALCGYEGEHEMPDEWECLAWSTQGGLSLQNRTGNENQHRERVWFSPHCLKPEQGQQSLFEVNES